MSFRDDIAIIGIGLRVPGASTVDAYWSLIRDGVESISRFSRSELVESGVPPTLADDPRYVAARGIIEAADEFDAHFFNYSPGEAAVIDPQQRIFLEVAWHALEDAGCYPSSFDGTIGIFAGVGVSVHLMDMAQVRGVRQPGAESLVLGGDKDFLATRAAYKLNLTGPAVTVQTACSTSLAAVHLACQSLLLGECDVALAGGVSVKVPQRVGYLYEDGGVHSPDGSCRPYDADAKGMVGGNGAAVVVLRREAEARAAGHRVYAIVRGSAINNDGATKLGFTAPSVTGQKKVIAAAQEMAAVEARSIGYIEGHGTGTALGDPAEVNALTSAFRTQTDAVGFCALGSVKANIGHLDTAAGAAGLIKAALALYHRTIPSTVHAHRAPAYLEGTPFYVSGRAQPWHASEPRRAGITSLGVGGTNVHVVLEEAPPAPAPELDAGEQLLVVSARTPTALGAAKAALGQHLQDAPDAALADVAFTLQTGRGGLEYRWSGVCRSVDEAVQILSAREGEASSPDAAPASTSTIFMFPGGGGAPIGDLGSALRRFRPARDVLEQGDRSYRRLTGTSLADGLPFADMQQDREPLAVSLPALFLYEMALAHLLIDVGIEPAGMLGHSLGEYTAACLAGVFDLDDAMTLVVARGRLLDSLPDGAMTSVSLTDAELRPFLSPRLCIAAVNAPSVSVVSGPVPDVEALERRLLEAGIDASRLPIRVAAHSAMLDPVLNEFARHVSALSLRPPQRPLVSTLTGSWMQAEDATRVDYWVRQFRGCVRFADAVRTAAGMDSPTLVEVGPGRTLSSAARAHPQAERAAIVTVGRHRLEAGSDWHAFLRALGLLWARGLPVRLPRLHGERAPRMVSLPGYPFERSRYSSPRGDAKPVGALGSLDPQPASNWCYAPGWRATPHPAPRSSGRDDALLVFAYGEGPTHELDRALRAEHPHVTTVVDGLAFRQVSPSVYQVGRSVSDYVALLRTLAGQGVRPTLIVHCWTIAAAPANGAGAFYDEHGRAAGSLIALVQALDRVGITDPIALLVASTGLEDTNGADPLVPERGTLIGLRAVIPQEHPNIQVRTVDVALDDVRKPRTHRVIAALKAEAVSDAPEPRVAYRGARRLVHQWLPFPLTGAGGGLRREGVYAVVGGLGRIGRTIARHLADRYRAKLVLIGRRQMDADISAFLSDLAARGGEVVYVSANGADADGLMAAIGAGVGKFGPLNGVVHAAGVMRSAGDTAGRSISELADHDLREQFHAKVDGLYALDEALHHHEPDFCLICGSLASSLGGLGFGAYAAANSFIDAFAAQRAHGGRTRWVAVDWDAWDFRTGTPRPMRRDEEAFALGPADALRVLESIIGARVHGQVAVSQADMEARISRVSKTVRDGAAADRPRAASARPALRTAFVPPSTDTERDVAQTWKTELGLADVGADDNFFDLGGHSLLATRIVHRLRRAFRVSLPLRLLFEQPTVRALAAHIERLLGTAAGSAQAMPVLRHDPDLRYEPFPLTEVQEAYWVGRRSDLALGNIATHSYLEIDCAGLDVRRLDNAWTALVRRHDMLRMIVSAEGQQRVLPADVTYRIPVADVRASNLEEDAALRATRGQMSHQVLPANEFPLFDLRVTLRAGGGARLHVSLDRLLCDAWSTRILARDLIAAYDNGVESLPPLDVTFRDYVMAVEALETTPDWQRARDYWIGRLDTLPPGPQLPLAVDPSRLAQVRFCRRAFRLEPDEWRRFSEAAAARGVTPSGALLAAFAHALARWSQSPRFTINLTLFNRWPLHPQINDIVGDFTSITLLEADPSRGETFERFAGRMQGRLWEDVDHRHFSGISVMRELRRRRGVDAAMPVVFTSTLGLPGRGEDRAQRLGAITYSITQTPQVWLDHQVFERDGALVLQWDTVDELFPPGLLDEMFAAYRGLTTHLMASTDAWTWSGRRLLAAATPHPPTGASGMTSDPLRYPTLHGSFQTRAARQPDAAAMIAWDGELSYSALAALTASGHRALRQLGAGPGDVVAVMMDKGAGQIVAVLSVLHAGAAYLPIEPSLPPDRVRHILRSAGSRVVLVDDRSADRLIWPRGLEVLRVDELVPDERAPAPPPLDEDVRRLAYVIYTSGSTGTPKGVMVDHRGAMNTILDVNERFDVGTADRVLALSSLGFDLSVYDVFGLLAAGGAVVMPESSQLRDPAAWARLLDEHRVTIWNSVPALMDLLLDYCESRGRPVFSELRLVLLSGDWVPVTMPGRVRRWFPRARVVALGGATEASVWSNVYEVDEVPPGAVSIPYGRALRGQTLTVRDRWLDPCPAWAPGEICIGGAGVSLGYWNDAARTAGQFLPDPDGLGRMYRTGDLGRLLPGGDIELLGRLDHQVKVHGHRIELGEIESALNRHDAVRESVAIATGPRTDRQVVAFVVAEDGCGRDALSVSRRAAEWLPRYMVPERILFVDGWPLTPNGKVDRACLARMADAAPEPAEAQPSSPEERAIAAAFTEVLGCRRVPLDQNFFQLGGDSLKAVRLLTRLRREFGDDLTLRDVFDHPTVTGVSARIASARVK